MLDENNYNNTTVILPEWLRHAEIVVDNAKSPTYSFSESVHNEIPSLRRTQKLSRRNLKKLSSNSYRKNEIVTLQNQKQLQNDMKHIVSPITVRSCREEHNDNRNDCQFPYLTANYSSPSINRALRGSTLSSSSVSPLPLGMYGNPKTNNSSSDTPNEPILYDSCPQKPKRRRSLVLDHLLRQMEI